VAREEGPGGLPDAGHHESTEKRIGRRAFLALMAVGAVAFVFGRDVFSRLLATPGAGGFAINSIRTPDPIDLNTWRLTVGGLVKTPLDLSWTDFLALPQSKETQDFTCVEGWGVRDVEWTGVHLHELIDRAGPAPDATHLVFLSSDLEYYDSLTLAEARANEVMLARELNGEALAFEHGWPVRLVTPGLYGYKYVKWVMKINVITAADKGPNGHLGYWENRGYPADATIG
jgi:DMSO/TMAO reductase YedYZ molybdopterin-dependent catalytic subunit